MTETSKPFGARSAPIISRILKQAGVKKAITRGNSWSSGFEVTDFGRYVRITYSTVNAEQEHKFLAQIDELINNRPGEKYFAQVVPITEGSTSLVVKVYAYDGADPEQNEVRRAAALEKLAVEHSAAPEIKDVRAALLRYGYEFVPDSSAGFHIERKSDDTRLVRVTYRETSFTTYEGDKEQMVLATVENWGNVLVKAGFDVMVDYDDDWSLIVGMPGEFTPVDDSPEKVAEALAVLREAVERDSFEHMTRWVGPYALFVFNQGSGRRLEVAYINGVYLTKGWLSSGESHRFLKVDNQLLDFIRTELAC